MKSSTQKHSVLGCVRLLWIGFLCALLWLPGASLAKKYSKAQIQRMIAKEQARRIQLAQAKNKKLRQLKKAKAALLKKLNAAYCKRMTVPWIKMKCKRACVLSRPVFKTKRKCVAYKPLVRCVKKKRVFGKKICVKYKARGKRCVKRIKLKVPSGTRCIKRGKLCTPHKSKKRVMLCVKRSKHQLVVTINGKQEPITPGIGKAVEVVKKGFKKAQKKLKKASKKAGKQVKKQAKKVAKASKKAFEAALKAFRKKAKKLARKLAKMPVWKKKLGKVLKKTAGKQMSKAGSRFKSKLKAKLTQLLRSKKSRSRLNSMMRSSRRRARAMKANGKTALAAVGEIVVAEAARIVIACWSHKGQAKRRCLNREITNGARDATFDIVASLSQMVLDATVIEPVSHSLAAAVSASLASSTGGIGAAGYPICYGASTLSLNLVVQSIFEYALRPAYTQMFNSRLRPSVHRFVASFTRRLPKHMMQ